MAEITDHPLLEEMEAEIQDRVGDFTNSGNPADAHAVASAAQRLNGAKRMYDALLADRTGDEPRYTEEQVRKAMNQYMLTFGDEQRMEAIIIALRRFGK